MTTTMPQHLINLIAEAAHKQDYDAAIHWCKTYNITTDIIYIMNNLPCMDIVQMAPACFDKLVLYLQQPDVLSHLDWTMLLNHVDALYHIQHILWLINYCKAIAVKQSNTDTTDVKADDAKPNAKDNVKAEPELVVVDDSISDYDTIEEDAPINLIRQNFMYTLKGAGVTNVTDQLLLSHDEFYAKKGATQFSTTTTVMWACDVGCMPIVLNYYTLPLLAPVEYECFMLACSHGHLDIVNHIQKCATKTLCKTYPCALIKACEQGHLNIVDWIFTYYHSQQISGHFNGIPVGEEALAAACKGGHLNIVLAIYNKCNCNMCFPKLADCFKIAFKNKHYDIVNWFAKKYPDKFTYDATTQKASIKTPSIVEEHL